MPKCHWFPFRVCFISGSRSLFRFFVEVGASMMLAATILPSFSITPSSDRCSLMLSKGIKYLTPRP